jgi:hypothetical protein
VLLPRIFLFLPVLLQRTFRFSHSSEAISSALRILQTDKKLTEATIERQSAAADMGKKDRLAAVPSADSSQPVHTFTAPSATFDAALASLFATSVGDQVSCYLS